MHRLAIVVLILGLSAATVQAQQSTKPTFMPAAAVAKSADAKKAAAAAAREAEKRRRRADFVDASTIERVSASLARRTSIGQTIHTSADDQTTYLLVRRKASSAPEVHARWDDLVIVRAGTGAIEMGDSLAGSTYRAPGERTGGKFSKSYQLVVHAGDIVRIPAAVPHAFIVSGAGPLEYLVIKQRRQDLPIRWYGEK